MALEEQIKNIKREFEQINRANREQMGEQRDSFEVRMKEMEEEVTKVSLNRYKNELEQKQKFLKLTKKYDEQLREMRHCLGFVLAKVGINEFPEYLQEDLACSISEVRIQNKDLLKVLERFEITINDMKAGKGQTSDLSNIKYEYDQLLKAYKSELLMRRGLHN